MKPQMAKLLVVDDSAPVREVIAGLLRDLGIASIEQADGLGRALELVRDHAYDVVIADAALAASGELQQELGALPGPRQPALVQVAHGQIAQLALARALTEELLPALSARDGAADATPARGSTPRLPAEAERTLPASFDWRSQVAEREVEIEIAGGRLGASLFTPASPRAAVIWANPSGIARLSSQERFAASTLARAGIATLLVDLLTDEEDDVRDGAHDDVPRLAERILDSARWLGGERALGDLPLGYLGAGAAGAAALVAAAHDARQIFAVVLTGAHPEQAGAALLLSHVPTLFIVGAGDLGAAATAHAACRLRTQRRVESIPCAIGGIVDGEALSNIAALASAWFSQWLTQPRRGGAMARPQRAVRASGQ